MHIREPSNICNQILSHFAINTRWHQKGSVLVRREELGSFPSQQDEVQAIPSTRTCDSWSSQKNRLLYKHKFLPCQMPTVKLKKTKWSDQMFLAAALFKPPRGWGSLWLRIPPFPSFPADCQHINCRLLEFMSKIATLDINLLPRWDAGWLLFCNPCCHLAHGDLCWQSTHVYLLTQEGKCWLP